MLCRGWKSSRFYEAVLFSSVEFIRLLSLGLGFCDEAPKSISIRMSYLLAWICFSQKKLIPSY